jgi:hypothetical protein
VRGIENNGAEIIMAMRPTLKKLSEEGSDVMRVDQTRPKEERFLLRVDGQIKRSFDSKESALPERSSRKLIPS